MPKAPAAKVASSRVSNLMMAGSGRDYSCTHAVAFEHGATRAGVAAWALVGFAGRQSQWRGSRSAGARAPTAKVRCHEVGEQW